MASRNSKHPVDFLAYREAALLVARSLTGNGADAEDVVQEAYLKACRFKGHVPEGAPRRAWFLRVVANQAKDHRLGEAKRRGEERAASTARCVRGDTDQYRTVERREERRAVARALQYLEAKFRLPLTLHYENGLSYAEVAEVLDMPSGTVRVYAHRGLKKMKQLLMRWRFAVAPLWVLAAMDLLPEVARS